jgi:ABC-type transport system involved in cytochrome c biogenesis permease subunit
VSFSTLNRCVLAIAAAIGISPAAASDRLDWGAWQRLPVLHDGRIKPADTLARQIVQAVCGRESPRLSLAGAASAPAPASGEPASEAPGAAAGLAEAAKLFAGDQPDAPRGFSPAELLFSWIAQPARWERVPFLIASNEELRRDVLGLPLAARGGTRLKYASPWQVARAAKFHARWSAILEEQRRAQAAEKRYEPAGVDKAVSELAVAYGTYRLVAFRPEAPGGVRRRFRERLAEVVETWRGLQPDLERLPRLEGPGGTDPVAATSEATNRLMELAVKGEAPPWIPLSDAESVVVKLRESTAALAAQVESLAKRFSESPPEVEQARLDQVRVRLRAMAAGTANLARLADELHGALYDNGRTMAVVPALNAAALDRNRDPGDDAQPWLSIQAVLFGSPRLLRDYPQAELAEVRSAFADLSAVYADQDNPARAERFAPAMQRFVAAVGRLGGAVEPLRERLPIAHRDDELIAATAYPPQGFTDLEVLYNRLELFLWTWVLSLAGVVVFALAVGKFRKPLFWLGMLLVAAGQAAAIGGLAARTAITGRAPVTNMFETVVFVALVVALLGLWFTLLPLAGRGVRAAWRLAAVPGTWEAAPLGPEERTLFGKRAWRRANWLLLVPRALLAYFVFAAFALVPYGEKGGSAAISLLPRADVGASMPTVSDLVVWIVGLAVLGLCVWYLPRAILAVVVSLWTVPYVMAKQGIGRPLALVVARKPLAMAGAAVAFFTGCLAYYTPVFDRNISPLMPVLRHNFWLASHVMTICASYGAGALAWGLGSTALVHYLFGRYRDPAGATGPVMVLGEHRPAGDYHAPAGALARRPPEVCAALGTYIYKATQVAVLLLAAGTILGALWADVSWGRFWGWDPKEVWALISLLVYLAVLHGRYAGWFGNFGLAVGSVFGATSILMAWYGVNFVLGSGKHFYGEGSGGLIWVVLAVALNWAFVAAAAARYFLEVGLSARAASTPRNSSASEIRA